MARMVAAGTGRGGSWCGCGSAASCAPGATAAVILGDAGSRRGAAMPGMPGGRMRHQRCRTRASCSARSRSGCRATSRCVGQASSWWGTWRRRPAVLSNVGLIAELRESRQRMVTARDQARRRLERNMHDGAQQQLVALAIKLRLGAVVGEDPRRRGSWWISCMRNRERARELRDLARRDLPAAAARPGLAAALNAGPGNSADAGGPCAPTHRPVSRRIPRPPSTSAASRRCRTPPRRPRVPPRASACPPRTAR